MTSATPEPATDAQSAAPPPVETMDAMGRDYLIDRLERALAMVRSAPPIKAEMNENIHSECGERGRLINAGLHRMGINIEWAPWAFVQLGARLDPLSGGLPRDWRAVEVQPGTPYPDEPDETVPVGWYVMGGQPGEDEATPYVLRFEQCPDGNDETAARALAARLNGGAA